jgi:hypothetical protein
MENEQIALKLQETIDRTNRNEGRIKKLEGEYRVIYDLATSVAVMAEQVKIMGVNVNSLTEKVDDLEGRPGERWDSIIDKIWLTIIAAIVGFALAQIGL